MADDFYAIQNKGSNYLLVAHAAGLVGCLSVIKDYATVTQLKGIGTFIVIFGVGFLAAIAYHFFLAISHTLDLNKQSEDFRVKTGTFAVVAMLASLVALVAAIILVMARFKSL